MACLPRVVVVLTFLSLPARLLGQFGQPNGYPAQPDRAQPAPVAAVPIQELESEPGTADPAADLSSGGCLSWTDLIRINDTPACGPPRQSVFVFGGLHTKRSMGNTLDVFNVTYDSCYLIALGYQRYHFTTGRFHWGWEVGTAGRYGDGYNQEFWGGATVRHEGITLFNCLRIAPSATAGFSTVTDTMGQEVHRERAHNGDGTFLYYLGPDFAASLTSHPNIELFYRLHHRCGGGGSLGRLREGYNANVVGLRFRF